MYISHKSNVLQTVHETEWQCRRLVKGLDKSEYWTWLDSVTSGDPPVVDYSGETGYTIVECTDEDVQARLNQLGDYQSSSPETGTVYNIKYYASKRDAEEILDSEGNSHDPVQYVQSHFVGDDTTKDARLLADKWTAVRRDRDNRLTGTDWVVIKAKETSGTVPASMKTYRQALRDVPNQSDPEDITWPTKP